MVTQHSRLEIPQDSKGQLNMYDDYIKLRTKKLQPIPMINECYLQR